MLRRPRVRRTRRGTYRLELPAVERDVLRHLLPQLRELLTGDAPADGRVRRLFPVAYPDDAAAEAEYQGYMRDELVTARLAALDDVEGTLDVSELSEEQLLDWMRSVNSLRLVLGTLLDVGEEVDLRQVPDDDPDVQAFALYAYLSALLEEIVDALGRGR